MKFFSRLFGKQSSDEKTNKILEASKFTLDSGIELDSNDMIGTVREGINVRETLETLSSIPIQEHENIFEVLEYDAENKMM